MIDSFHKICFDCFCELDMKAVEEEEFQRFLKEEEEWIFDMERYAAIAGLSIVGVFNAFRSVEGIPSLLVSNVTRLRSVHILEKGRPEKGAERSEYAEFFEFYFFRP